MSRICAICADPRLDEINSHLVRGDPIAGLAREFAVSEDALRRHKASHLPKTLMASPSAQEVANADDLLSQIKNLQVRTLTALEKAEAEENILMVFKGVREARENLRLLGEVAGKLQSQPTVNVLLNPQWVELRTLIITALDLYPEAREAVVNAIC